MDLNINISESSVSSVQSAIGSTSCCEAIGRMRLPPRTTSGDTSPRAESPRPPSLPTATPASAGSSSLFPPAPAAPAPAKPVEGDARAVGEREREFECGATPPPDTEGVTPALSGASV